MNRIRLLAIGTMLMFALTTVAQQTTTNSDAHGGSGGGVPTPQGHLKVLTEKLALTGDQQAPSYRSCMTPRRSSCRTKVCRAKSAWAM